MKLTLHEQRNSIKSIIGKKNGFSIVILIIIYIYIYALVNYRIRV
jgi:hypothetical protein